LPLLLLLLPVLPVVVPWLLRLRVLSQPLC
jgi:hypothetical protein